MKKLVACCSLLVVFLLFTTTTHAALIDKYPCGAPDQIQIGTTQEDCLQDDQTCTAYSHYLFTDENGQAWCDNNNCTEPCDSPTPTPTLTPIPISKIATPSSEELAVYNLNQGLLPKEAIPNAPKDENFVKQILNFLTGWTSIFMNSPSNSLKLYAQSESIQQATVPKELKPNSENKNILEKLQNQFTGFLGSSAGIYGVNLPTDIQGNIKQSEKIFEQANFPAGINPITGQK